MRTYTIATNSMLVIRSMAKLGLMHGEDPSQKYYFLDLTAMISYKMFSAMEERKHVGPMTEYLLFFQGMTMVSYSYFHRTTYDTLD